MLLSYVKSDFYVGGEMREKEGERERGREIHTRERDLITGLGHY